LLGGGSGLAGGEAHIPFDKLSTNMDAMKIQKVVKAKLDCTEEQARAFGETIRIYSQALNFISEIAYENQCSNKIRLHELAYRKTRERFPELQANHVVRAVRQVAACYRRGPRKFHKFKLSSPVELDARTWSYRPKELAVSISTTRGRMRWIGLQAGDYGRKLLATWDVTHSAELIERNGDFYLYIVIEKQVTPSGINPIGVDLGMNNLATTSKGQKFSGKQALHLRRKFLEKRRKLQAKGTRSAKRLLKRLSGRENRRMCYINHVVSRRIVDSLQPGDVLVLEDLSGIRETVKHRKSQNYLFHSWAFYQLQKFLEYKALEKNIPVVYVDPGHTSQSCPRCGHIESSNRNGPEFRCQKCGYYNNADYVASYNIASLYVGGATGCRKPASEATSDDPETALAGLTAS